MLTASIPAHAELTAALTPLVGREREIATITCLLLDDHVRLLTLTGPGGVGKTRLALAVAESVHDDFRDGVTFVPLALVDNPGLVGPAIAHALNVRQSSQQPLVNSLRDALHDRHLLLVLDNFEHVLPAVSLVAELLARCPGLSILVTSRAVLHLYGERGYLVPPLRLPNSNHLQSIEDLEQYEAVHLFIDRAQEARDDFELTPGNAAAVAAICARLDGLPLAIELAAARSRMLSPQALLARLEDRLHLLTGGPRNAPVRQQTIRNTVAWSYDLLSADNQLLLGQLAHFVGGWTLESAEAVCDPEIDVFEGLMTLSDHSLIHQIDRPDGSARFTMLETIREYALEQLETSGTAGATRVRHAGYLLQLAEQTSAASNGPDHHQWLNRLEDERSNLYSALRYSIEQAPGDLGLRLATALYGFWYIHGPKKEGALWIERALARSSAAPAELRVRALYQLGEFARIRGEYVQATDLGEQSLALATQANNEGAIASAWFLLGNIASSNAQDDRAIQLFEEALLRYRALDDPDRVAFVLNNLGQAVSRRGDIDRATVLFEESLAIWRSIGSKWGTAIALISLGESARDHRDYLRARDYYLESLTLMQSFDDHWGIVDCLYDLAEIMLELKQPQRTVCLFSAAEKIRVTLGIVPGVGEQARQRRILDTARAALDSVAFTAAWEQGQAVHLNDVVQVAVEPVAVPTAAQPVSRLTARELDVVRLLIDGLSNHEISDALFISPHTVANHVASIMNKLGMESRTAVATWALRHGVV